LDNVFSSRIAYHQAQEIIVDCALCVVVPATDGGYKVAYDGGSIQNVKSGKALRMYIDSTQIRLEADQAELMAIPVAAITEISYGQDVHEE